MSGSLTTFDKGGFATVTPGVPVFGDPVQVAAYAATMFDATRGYIRSLGVAAEALTPPVITPVFPTPDAAPAPITTTVPTMQTVVWTVPAVPAAFSYALDIGGLMPAPFDEDPPVLVFPGAPAAFTEALPDAPAVDLVFDDPTLSVVLPAPPNLLSLQTYQFDGVTLPTLTDSDIPVLNLVAPSVLPYTPGETYTSALLTAINVSLLDRITNGGTGLNPDAEQAIWDRGRERELRAQREALDSLERMESLGYALPPGVYTDARLKVLTETTYAMAGHSREVMIKQAELEQTNVLAALERATVLEGTMITYTNQVEQRLFDASKYATEAGIAIYNAQVQTYVAYLDAYKTKIAIYEAQIRGALALVDVYKAQIQAEQAKAQINVALVEQYKVQVDAALSAIRIYEAELGGIKTKAEIEGLKISVFGEQVKAYGARINAYTAGVEGYRATIQAEGVKQEAFKSAVMSYTAQVDASVKQAEAKIREFEARIQERVQAWDAYKAAYGAEAERARAISAANSSAAETYRATVAGTSSYNELLTKQWQVVLDQASRTTEIGVSAAKANAELYMTARSLGLDASKVGATVSAQLGAAALNAVHWSQSYGMSVQAGVNGSVSYNYNASV